MINASSEWHLLPELDQSRIVVLLYRYRLHALSYFDFANAAGIDIAEPIPGHTTITTANSDFAAAYPGQNEVWPQSGPDPDDFALHRASFGIYPPGGQVPLSYNISGDPIAQSAASDLDWTVSFTYACAITRMLFDLFHIRPRGRPKEL